MPSPSATPLPPSTLSLSIASSRLRHVFTSLLVSCLFLVCFCSSITAADEDILTLHIIPHSHCDPGWLNTFEGYYSQEVHGILDGILREVGKESGRRFVWSEISFFHRWYEALSLQDKESFARLVKNHQIEFVNGGWVQNDEASPDFLSSINQWTVGHEYLLKNFGVKPVIAWQIDPFGHSSTTPSIASLAGFEALVINRIHHSLKDAFKEKQTMEFLWRGAEVGDKTELLTHVLHTHYSAPQGFDWEEGAIGIDTGNVEWRSQELVNTLKSRAQAFRTKNLLVPFGDDFKFRNAGRQFENMDRLISHVNSHRRQFGVHMRYSTLHEYFHAIQSGHFPVFKGDFFPYADNEDSYWTGYYTTRPLLKKMSRALASLLRAAEGLHVLVRAAPRSNLDTTLKPLHASYWENKFKDIEKARMETALFLHHDAITGTSKGHVVADYDQRMSDSSNILLNVMARMIEHLMTKEPNPSPALTPDANTLEEPGEGEEGVYHPVVFYNSLGWARSEIQFVKTTSRNVKVYDWNNKQIPCQVSFYWPHLSDRNPSTSVFRVHFQADMPALGASTYYVWIGPGKLDDPLTVNSQSVVYTARVDTANQLASKYLTYSAYKDGEMFIENKFLRLDVSGGIGLASTLTDKSRSVKHKFEQRYGQYSTHRSGAYLFRPTSGAHDLGHEDTTLKITKGPVLEFVEVMYKGFEISYTIILSDSAQLGKAIELHQHVQTSTNNELVCKFSTDIKNDRTFYTNSGLEFMKRTRKDNMIAANFYPSVVGSRIASQDAQITFISQHSCGASSQGEGELEFMIHRSLGQDDGRGLGEGVHDSNRLDVPFVISLDYEQDDIDFTHRSLRFNHPVRIFYKQPGKGQVDHVIHPKVWLETMNVMFSGLKTSLPPHIHMLSFLARDSITDDTVMRLQNIGNPSPTSTWVIPFNSLFSEEFEVSELRRTTLSLHTTIGQEGYKREMSFHYASDTPTHSLQSIIGNGGRVRSTESQNSDEQGVFVSQAALEKMAQEREKAANGGKRRLLEAELEERIEERLDEAGIHEGDLRRDLLKREAIEDAQHLQDYLQASFDNDASSHDAISPAARHLSEEPAAPAAVPSELHISASQIQAYIFRLVRLDETVELPAKSSFEKSDAVVDEIKKTETVHDEPALVPVAVNADGVKVDVKEKPTVQDMVLSQQEPIPIDVLSELPADFDPSHPNLPISLMTTPRQQWNNTLPSTSEYVIVFFICLIVVSAVLQIIRFCLNRVANNAPLIPTKAIMNSLKSKR